MGNEEGKVILQKSELVNLEFKKEEYFESQLVEGFILFTPTKEIYLDEIVIKIKMFQSFKIYESKDKYINNFLQKKIILKRLNLPNIFNCLNSQNIPIKIGIHKIPFKFFLPKNIPPSFEYPRENKKGNIRYIFTAEIISGKEKYITEEYLIIKQRAFIYPPQTILKIQDKKVIKVLGKIKGESELSVYIPSKNIKINEPIKFEVNIDNTKNEEDVIKINIKVIRIVLFSKNNDIYKYETTIINKKNPTKCLKGEKKMFIFDDIILRDNELKEIEFNEKIFPYLGRIKDLNILMPSMETPIMRCEYKLEISTIFDINVLDNDRPTVVIPIYVSHQLQSESENDKIIIQGQYKNIPKDVGQYAPVYIFDDENNNNNNNNENNNNFEYQIITCNDFPTLESINRELMKRANNNLNNGYNGQGGYNPYNNKFP